MVREAEVVATVRPALTAAAGPVELVQAEVPVVAAILPAVEREVPALAGSTTVPAPTRLVVHQPLVAVHQQVAPELLLARGREAVELARVAGLGALSLAEREPLVRALGTIITRVALK